MSRIECKWEKSFNLFSVIYIWFGLGEVRLLNLALATFQMQKEILSIDSGPAAFKCSWLILCEQYAKPLTSETNQDDSTINEIRWFMRHKNLEVIFKMKLYRMHNIQSALSSRQISKMKKNWLAITTTAYNYTEGHTQSELIIQKKQTNYSLNSEARS